MRTIKEVAEDAGVSVATVSRVINNSEKVKPETVRRVQASIEKLHYKLNISARNLRRTESGAILVIIPNITSPFYAQILLGINDTANKFNYNVLICQTNMKMNKEKEFINMLKSKQADGAIILKAYSSGNYIKKIANEYPVIQCAEYFENLPIPRVSIDNYKAAFEAIEYLVNLGHRKIGMLSADNNVISTIERKRGYIDALKSANIDYNEEIVQDADGEYSFDSAIDAAKRILKSKDRPDAIFCISDILALGCIRAMEQFKLAVPKDISIIGFDDIEFAKYFHPTLTTIKQPCYYLGCRSMEMLYKLINEPELCHDFQVIAPHKLIIRESTSSQSAGK